MHIRSLWCILININTRVFGVYNYIKERLLKIIYSYYHDLSTGNTAVLFVLRFYLEFNIQSNHIFNISVLTVGLEIN